MTDTEMTVQTLYTNGAIRNAAGKLVAFYDKEAKALHVDGVAQTIPAQDEAEAMEIVGDRRREVRVLRAYEYGYEAGVEGERRENPYGEGCREHKAWEAGFEQGAHVRREIANGA